MNEKKMEETIFHGASDIKTSNSYTLIWTQRDGQKLPSMKMVEYCKSPLN